DATELVGGLGGLAVAGNCDGDAAVGDEVDVGSAARRRVDRAGVAVDRRAAQGGDYRDERLVERRAVLGRAVVAEPDTELLGGAQWVRDVAGAELHVAAAVRVADGRQDVHVRQRRG